MLKSLNHMVLLVLFLPGFIAGLEPQETGRYQYSLDSDPQTKKYCLWCKSKYLLYSKYRSYQVEECIQNNFPFDNKTDKYEQEHQLRPICNDGVLPTCQPLPEVQSGTWDCGNDVGYIYNYTQVPPYQTCRLNCKDGFEVAENQSSVYCNESRLWFPSDIPKCIVAVTVKDVPSTVVSESVVTSQRQNRSTTSSVVVPLVTGIAAVVLVVVVAVFIVVWLSRNRCRGKMDPEC